MKIKILIDDVSIGRSIESVKNGRGVRTLYWSAGRKTGNIFTAIHGSYYVLKRKGEDI